MADGDTEGGTEPGTIRAETGTTGPSAVNQPRPETTADGALADIEGLDLGPQSTGSEAALQERVKELEAQVEALKRYRNYQERQQSGLVRRIHELEARQEELIETLREIGKTRGASDGEPMSETSSQEQLQKSIPLPVYPVLLVGIALIAMSITVNVEITYPLVGIGLVFISAMAAFESRVHGNRKR